jgi:hypothetical protein
MPSTESFTVDGADVSGDFPPAARARASSIGFTGDRIRRWSSGYSMLTVRSAVPVVKQAVSARTGFGRADLAEITEPKYGGGT